MIMCGFVSIVLSQYKNTKHMYVFYMCFVFLVLCELLYCNAMLLHAVVNCILLMSVYSVSVLAGFGNLRTAIWRTGNYAN